MQEEETILNNDEVMKLLTLSGSSLREYRKNGLPFEKDGRNYRYPKSKVIEWQKSRQENAVMKLHVGKGYLNHEIEEILGCSGQGGMRRSHKTGTLALFTDSSDTKNPYQDRWLNGVLHYTGMGQEGNQVLHGNANIVLAKTYENALTAVHLFETYVEKKPKQTQKTFHRYIGIVQMIAKEYKELEKGRIVYKFPLQIVTGEKVYSEPDFNNVQYESQRKLSSLSDEEIKRRAIIASERNKLKDSEHEGKNKNKNRAKHRRMVRTVVYDRDEFISAYVKLLAKGKCQLCKHDAPFNDEYGVPYLECHHIVWLSEGGKDTIENCIALCPNCHRKMHSLALLNDVEILKQVVLQTYNLSE